MSDRRYHARITLAFLGDPVGWGAIEATADALVSFMIASGDVDKDWHREYRASANGAFGTGASVAELREAWERNHLDVDHFSLTFYGRSGRKVTAEYVSALLLPSRSQHGVDWGGSIGIHGSDLIAVRTFAIDLADAVRRSLRERFQAAEVVALEPTAMTSPERVPVGIQREPGRPKTPTARRKRPNALSGRQARVSSVGPGSPPAVQAPSGTSATSVEVVELPGSASSPKKAPWLVRLFQETATKVVSSVLATLILALLVAWNLLPK